MAENFFGIMKSELLYAEKFESPEAFIKALNEYIDYYNNKRIKSRLNGKRVSKKYLAPSIYSYPYWRLKSNIRFYKGVFCLFGHPLLSTSLELAWAVGMMTMSFRQTWAGRVIAKMMVSAISSLVNGVMP